MATKPFNAGEIIRQLETELFDDFGETAFAIARNLITRSPVGDPDRWQDPDSAPPGYTGGHFRRNWIVSIGGFNESILEGTDANGATTVAAALAEIESFQRGKFGVNLVIQNNVPYANRLALGHSPLAEAGWVDEEIELALEEPGGEKDLD
jgi:hypothetical protein